MGGGERPDGRGEAGAAAGRGGASRSSSAGHRTHGECREDVYEAAMLRATYDGYDNASEVVEAALREWARGY